MTVAAVVGLGLLVHVAETAEPPPTDAAVQFAAVALRPAREFPADGAAGEGFTNAAEALSDVSPPLLAKYLSAAKEIAQHAVLLPDGFRFSPAKTRRDWTNESLARLRQEYAEFA